MTTTDATSASLKIDGRGKNPKSLANLIPYKPGQNGNPKPGNSLLAVLKNALTKEKRLEIINSTIEGAILREPAPFHEVWDRVEGKVPDKNLLLGDILIEVVFRDLPQLSHKEIE